ncbi:MAG TPA: apolipoprotein N-acyltransferase [Noviherbaspirillum sp.]
MNPARRLSLATLIAPLVALAAGAFNVFAFAPFGLWPLQILTLALVFALVLRASSARAAALLGWAYGTGWLVAGVHWLYISMHRYGGLPGWMAILAVLALGITLGLFAALATGGARRLQMRLQIGQVPMLLLLLPAAWALAEWSRGWFLTGFPWVAGGYAHNIGPLAGFAPVVGVYGLGWLAALMAGALALLASPGVGRWRWLGVALVLTIPAAGLALRGTAWTTPHGEPITVRLLQGNVPQDLKFRAVDATLDLYTALITASPADLIATPETAIPVLSSRLPDSYFAHLAGFAAHTDSHLAIGIPFHVPEQGYANSVLAYAPDGSSHRYDKHHLVPFGEFIPVGAAWFVNMMQIPLGDFARGERLQMPFAVRDQQVLPNVCYEDLFGEEIAAQLRAGAAEGREPTLLLNVSNIAWFGDSIAVPQHLQISQMRALELGRPMLRATNTGATAVVRPDGSVQEQLAPFTRGVLTAEVQGFSGLTPYARFGNLPVVVLAFALLGAACLMGRKRSPVAGKSG